MSMMERLRVEKIEDDEVTLVRSNGERIEYPEHWIPFPVKVGETVSGIVLFCQPGVISRIHFVDFADEK